ncbi:hypothetical protein OIU78_025165 [Salix suchowensis]|nr:hypothetical protein OIU78_025165 [Salix suchowensis]
MPSVSGGFVLLMGEEGRQLNYMHGLKRFEKQINLGRDTCSLKEIKAILWTIGQMWRRNKASGENTVKGIKRSF